MTTPPPSHDPTLWNEDLAPTEPAARTWGRWHIAALWVGMAVCIPTYMLASGLLSQGLDWVTAMVVIMLGNLIVLVPMVLNAQPGTKYGIPFPVLARASFGVRGANIPAVMRALVACGWFGIQTWFGGLAIYTLGALLWPDIAESAYLGDFLGINLAQLVSFFIFWVLNMLVIVRGMEAIRFLETWSAPVLLALGLGLLVWGFGAGGGPSRVLEAASVFKTPVVTISPPNDAGEVTATLTPLILPDADGPKATHIHFAHAGSDATPEALALSLADAPWQALAVTAAGFVTLPLGPAAAGDKFIFQLKSPSAPSGTAPAEFTVPKERPPETSLFWSVFLPGLTAMVGYWASLSLNISDFTRFAKSQRDQAIGQAIGLPGTMVLYSFIGIAVTAASLILFDDVLWASDAPWDPVTLIGRLDNPIVVALAMAALAIATLTTNIAANVVSPANDFSALAPKYISFRTGGIITGVLGVLIMPWKLLASAGDYLFVWLIGYSALLGPVGGIMIADYFIVRRRHLEVDQLFIRDGLYSYSKAGINWRAVGIFAVSVAPNLPGFLAAAGMVDHDSVPGIFHTFYTYAWFLGFGIAFGLYSLFGTPRSHRVAKAI